MRCHAFTIRILLILGIVAFTVAAFAANPKETVLYTFQDQSDGYFPRGLVADAAGNLYGTSQGGDPIANAGVVYELSPPAQPGGNWTFTVLYTFQGGMDGIDPAGPLVLDRVGNLFGATVAGGKSNCHAGCGTIFELAAPSQLGGSWTKSQLYEFQGGPNDGAYPSGLVLDGKGDLYGTTLLAGSGTCVSTLGSGCGTVFQLTPPSNNSQLWVETVLHNFLGGTDGSNPPSGVIRDSLGNLYGETLSGGNAGLGTIFELAVPSQPTGAWTERVYAFNGVDGATPEGGLVGRAGALYGTTSGGGAKNAGTVFQMSLVNGEPNETILHSFTIDQTDYSSPMYGVVFDSAGNLYGATAAGACEGCDGLVFMLHHPSKPDGQWTFNQLYGFGDGTDGGDPSSALIAFKGGLYGTTLGGGDLPQCENGCGVIYSITAQ